MERWKDLSNPDWRNETEPSKKSCYIRNYDYDNVNVDEDNDFANANLPLLRKEEIIPCTSWEFDTTFWKRTIIMDFDLVCDVSRNLFPG